MLYCSDNDHRWSDGQPFTFILAGFDATYPIDDFLGGEMAYEVDVNSGGNQVSHCVIWMMIKSIKDVTANQITVVLLAKDPLRGASGGGGGGYGPPIRGSVKGPVAMFKSNDPTKVNVAHLILAYSNIQEV